MLVQTFDLFVNSVGAMAVSWFAQRNIDERIR